MFTHYANLQRFDERSQVESGFPRYVHGNAHDSWQFLTCEGQTCSLPMKIRILTRFAEQPPWERASPCSREPQVAGQNVVSAARYLVARNSLPPDRCKVAW